MDRMEQDAKKKRGFARHRLPVVIEVPELSEVPLVPEDISSSGFGVVLQARPEEGRMVDCTLQVGGAALRNCRARIVWVRRHEEEAGAWSVGLSVELSREVQAKLEEAMHGLSADFLSPG
ncbi:MAG: PilZ domain-containing protein [Nitrospinota bacterium]